MKPVKVSEFIKVLQEYLKEYGDMYIKTPDLRNDWWQYLDGHLVIYNSERKSNDLELLFSGHFEEELI